MIEPALKFIGRQLRQGIEIKGIRNTRVSEIPPLALREALVNALVHADYSQHGGPIRLAVFDDRVEIENPGLLPFGLTPEEAFNGVSKVRNRVLARVFKELDYIEQWGSGLQRIRDACEGMGLKAPILEELGNRVRLTLYRTRQKAPLERGRQDQLVLDTLKKRGPLSPGQIAKLLGLTPRATRNRMNALADHGLVRATGTSTKDPKRTYVLA
jgi:predicted HTH transcriptional regulator